MKLENPVIFQQGLEDGAPERIRLGTAGALHSLRRNAFCFCCPAALRTVSAVILDDCNVHVNGPKAVNHDGLQAPEEGREIISPVRLRFPGRRGKATPRPRLVRRGMHSIILARAPIARRARPVWTRYPARLA